MKFDGNKILDAVSEMNTELENLRKKYEEKSKELFHSAVKEFFEATPEIKSIHWTQYSPHFNDGEDCVFSRHDIYYSVNRNHDPDDEDYDDDDGEGDTFLSDRYTYKDAEKNLDDARKLLSEYERDPFAVSNLLEYPLSYYCANEEVDHQKPRDRWGNPSKKKVFDPRKTRDYILELEGRVKRIREEEELFPNKKQILENFNQIRTFIESIDESTIEDMFGNHVKVVVTAKGVDVQEYEHD